MGDWIVLSQPLALLAYGAALFFCLFERFYKATKGVFFLVSAVLSIAATGYLLLMGASLWEGAGLLLVFLLLNMGVRE